MNRVEDIKKPLPQVDQVIDDVQFARDKENEIKDESHLKTSSISPSYNPTGYAQNTHQNHGDSIAVHGRGVQRGSVRDGFCGQVVVQDLEQYHASKPTKVQDDEGGIIRINGGRS